VHLLLASQRLDEGRIQSVEGHLSYRIALRTFSSMESRSVIGVASAYELPSARVTGIEGGHTNLVRFKAAYVSGPCPVVPTFGADEPATAAGEAAVFGLRAGRLAKPEPDTTGKDHPAPAAESAGDGEESLLSVLIDRLSPQARRPGRCAAAVTRLAEPLTNCCPA